MIKEIKNPFLELIKNKWYILCLSLTAACSYGFFITHGTISIDDTVLEKYFVDGLSPVMGRWCIFYMNKIFHMAEYNEFITEFLSILIFMLAVTLWCSIFKKILGDRVSMWGYTAFSCIFISQPILSELLVYCLHNGVGIAYAITALAVSCFMRMRETKGKEQIIYFVFMTICLLFANGFYESMTVVFLIAVFMVLIIQNLLDEKKLKFRDILFSYLQSAGAMVIVLILRAIIMKVTVSAFHLQEQIGVLSTRQITEFMKWFENTEGLQDFFMILKRYWIMYYVDGIVYFPITMYMLAFLFVTIFLLVMSIKRKNGWLFLGVIVMWLIPVLMVLIEAAPTFYRASQYIPLYVAFAVLLLSFWLQKYQKRKWVSYVGIAIAIVGIYNQAFEMNHWFYVDYMKYEDAKNTMTRIATDLYSDYDYTKPIIFTGNYAVPNSLIEDTHVSYDSWQFKCIARITDVVDVHLKEKYYGPYGYNFSETPMNSVINWGIRAFDNNGCELISFWEMHGYDDFMVCTEMEYYDYAKEIASEMNSYPKSGYIQETDDYIIVNF